jgi:hypothetical protein
MQRAGAIGWCRQQPSLVAFAHRESEPRHERIAQEPIMDVDVVAISTSLPLASGAIVLAAGAGIGVLIGLAMTPLRSHPTPDLPEQLLGRVERLVLEADDTHALLRHVTERERSSHDVPPSSGRRRVAWRTVVRPAVQLMVTAARPQPVRSDSVQWRCEARWVKIMPMRLMHPTLEARTFPRPVVERPCA